MDKIQDYLKSINPQPGDQQAILIYGSKYRLWRDGEYLGIATWTEDGNVGDSFQTRIKKDDEGCQVTVYVADRWDLVFEY